MTWKKMTCETCDFCINKECHLNPPTAATYPSVSFQDYYSSYDKDKTRTLRNDYYSACSKYENINK